MKNKYFNLINLVILISLISFKTYGEEQFNFNVTEIKILNNGNLIKGLNKGEVNTNDGIVITADNFEYDKIKNILSAQGNVEFEDKLENYKIYSDSVTYYKNIEKVVTNKDSVAIYGKNKIIKADNFEYDKIKNILNAQGNVEFEDKLENYKIYSDSVTYYKNIEKVVTNKDSVAIYGKNKIIKADNFEYDKIKNILNAQGNVEFEDKLENYKIYSDSVTYYKNIEKVVTNKDLWRSMERTK